MYKELYLENIDTTVKVYIDGRIETKYREMLVSNQYSEHLRKVHPKFLTPIDNGTGYLQVTLYNQGKCKKHYVHRLVHQAHIGQIPEDLEIDHIDNIKSNNNLNNLQAISHAENIAKISKPTKTIRCVECNCIKTYKSKGGMCSSCASLQSRKVTRPNKDTLLDLVLSKSFEEVGRTYGVSGNAIKKWCKAYNIPHLRSELKKLL